MEQNKPQNQSIESLFGMPERTEIPNTASSTTTSTSETTNDQNLFDYSNGKTFIGVGNINSNRIKSCGEMALYLFGGAGLIIWGLDLLNDFHLIIGPILILVGIFVIWIGIEAHKMKCPVCKRLKAMDDIASEDLFADTDVTRFNVLYNGVHRHDNVHVKATKTAFTLRQCSYCGHVSGNLEKQTLASYNKDVDKM